MSSHGEMPTFLEDMDLDTQEWEEHGQLTIPLGDVVPSASEDLQLALSGAHPVPDFLSCPWQEFSFNDPQAISASFPENVDLDLSTWQPQESNTIPFADGTSDVAHLDSHPDLSLDTLVNWEGTLNNTGNDTTVPFRQNNPFSDATFEWEKYSPNPETFNITGNDITLPFRQPDPLSHVLFDCGQYPPGPATLGVTGQGSISPFAETHAMLDPPDLEMGEGDPQLWPDPDLPGEAPLLGPELAVEPKSGPQLAVEPGSGPEPVVGPEPKPKPLQGSNTGGHRGARRSATQDANAQRGSLRRQPRPPTADDWEQHRIRITRLYLYENKSLEDVACIMEKKENFWATPRMYKERFKKWGLRKNFKKAETEDVVHFLRENGIDAKCSRVRFRGRLVEFKWRGERYRNTKTSRTAPRLPSDVQVLSPLSYPSNDADGIEMALLAVRECANWSMEAADRLGSAHTFPNGDVARSLITHMPSVGARHPLTRIINFLGKISKGTSSSLECEQSKVLMDALNSLLDDCSSRGVQIVLCRMYDTPHPCLAPRSKVQKGVYLTSSRIAKACRRFQSLAWSPTYWLWLPCDLELNRRYVL